MKSTFWGVATLLGAVSICALAACPSAAHDQKVLTKAIQMIAGALQKGNNAQARKLAAAEAKKLDDLADLMQVFRPHRKGGLGTEDGFIIAAVGEVALAKGVRKNQQAWIGNARNLRNLGLAFANANAAQKANARANVKMVCTACHMKFKE